jgi:hypothetical protein
MCPSPLSCVPVPLSIVSVVLRASAGAPGRQAIHSCAVKFPDVAGSVVHLLMDFLGDANTASALDVVFFVREIIETNVKLREGIMQRLLDCFYQIRSSRVCACALWIIGEYSTDLPTIQASLAVLKASLGAVPFYTREQEEERAKEGKAEATAATASTGSKRPAVLADGTYATQVSASEAAAAGGAAVPNLRAVLLTGDFFLGSVVATSLTKLVLRMYATPPFLPLLFPCHASLGRGEPSLGVNGAWHLCGDIWHWQVRHGRDHSGVQPSARGCDAVRGQHASARAEPDAGTSD